MRDLINRVQGRKRFSRECATCGFNVSPMGLAVYASCCQYRTPINAGVLGNVPKGKSNMCLMVVVVALSARHRHTNNTSEEAASIHSVYHPHMETPFSQDLNKSELLRHQRRKWNMNTLLRYVESMRRCTQFKNTRIGQTSTAGVTGINVCPASHLTSLRYQIDAGFMPSVCHYIQSVWVENAAVQLYTDDTMFDICVWRHNRTYRAAMQ